MSNSIGPISSELSNDTISLSNNENGCDGIELQPSQMDGAIAAAESVVNEIMDDLRLEQASIDLAIKSILRDESICKDGVEAPLLPNIIDEPEPKKQNDARYIMDDPTDTSKLTEIEIAERIPLLEQTIVEEIDVAVANAVESVEAEKNTSSTIVSINGLKDEPIDGNTDDSTASDESFASLLPFSDADTVVRPTESGQTTPMKTNECAPENIHAIVHEIMASVDKLFECVF